MTPAAMKSTEPNNKMSDDVMSGDAADDGTQTQVIGPITSRNHTWVRTSPLITAICSTTIMGAALAVPLATMSAPAELRGVVLSMSLGVFSTIMAIAAGAALATQRRIH